MQTEGKYMKKLRSSQRAKRPYDITNQRRCFSVACAAAGAEDSDI